MNLKTYIENLQKFAKENPDLLEATVVYSRDDEGNGFQEVHYTPDAGIYEDRDFIPRDNIEEEGAEEYGLEENWKPNAVCIN